MNHKTWHVVHRQNLKPTLDNKLTYEQLHQTTNNTRVIYPEKVYALNKVGLFQ